MLFRSPNSTEAGVCPAGGRHNPTGSGDYTLFHQSGTIGEWRHCLKCQCLASQAYGSCVKGDRHDHDDEFFGTFSVANNDPIHPGQDGWTRCTKCYQLVYSKNGPGSCLAGAGHSFASNTNYKVMYGLITDPNKACSIDWKWCAKCQVLVYSKGNRAWAAGGTHDRTGSGNYAMTSFMSDLTFLVGRDQPTGDGTDYE
jgi:hypothetical protein